MTKGRLMSSRSTDIESSTKSVDDHVGPCVSSDLIAFG